MVVSRHYLLAKPSGPSRLKVFLDQRVIPFAIDMAGGCEVAVQRVSQRTGVRPAVLVGGAAGICLYLMSLLLRWRPYRST